VSEFQSRAEGSIENFLARFDLFFSGKVWLKIKIQSPVEKLNSSFD